MSERDPWHDGHELWSGLRAWFDDHSARTGPAALDALSDISSLRRLLDRAELAAVAAARRAGQSWAEIATRLGVTRQSAWERWRDLDAPDAAPALRSAPDLAPTRGIEAEAARELVAREHRRQSTVTVPSVIGMSWDEAREALVDCGLATARSDPDGPSLAAMGWPNLVVTDQSPESGAKVPSGSTITLWLERGGGSAGVREPRRPTPDPRSGRVMQPEPSEEAVG
jgi:transposase-like protein